MKPYTIAARETPTLPGRWTGFVITPDGTEVPVGYDWRSKQDALRQADYYRYSWEVANGVPMGKRLGKRRPRNQLVVRVNEGVVDDGYAPGATAFTKQMDEDAMREALR